METKKKMPARIAGTERTRKMLIKQLIRELEIAESVNGNNEVFYENYEFEKASSTFLSVDYVHVLDPETHPFVLLRCEAPAELKEEKRKRLMDGLEKCSGIRTDGQDVCQKCPYFKEDDCTGKLAKDALARIKELESK